MPIKVTNDELLEEKLRHDYQQEQIEEYRREQEEQEAELLRTNLLEETLEIMKSHGKFPKDVEYVSTLSTWCTWEEFAEIADFKYYSGYGGNEIDLHLKVVGTDWWLVRGEYDGSEWWEYVTRPTLPSKHGKLELRDNFYAHE